VLPKLPPKLSLLPSKLPRLLNELHLLPEVPKPDALRLLPSLPKRLPQRPHLLPVVLPLLLPLPLLLNACKFNNKTQ
jgi:hypothetical protein